MAYYLYNKGNNTSLYRMVETLEELKHYNIIITDYDIIEDSDSNNFLDCVLNKKYPLKHEDNTMFYDTTSINFKNKKELDNYINNIKASIKSFLDNNSNNSLFSKWNNYYNQLNSLNTDNINYPLNSSLEEYFYNLNLSVLNPLQIP
jgi:hypothetical protein